jgi:hypothetical protein
VKYHLSLRHDKDEVTWLWDDNEKWWMWLGWVMMIHVASSL